MPSASNDGVTVKRYVRAFNRMVEAWKKNPAAFVNVVKEVPTQCAARSFSHSYTDISSNCNHNASTSMAGNPLWDYFQNHKKGRGIWKWEHYFEIYHRHLSRFVGRSPRVLEIGIYSGGSLEMWRSYFGQGSHVYGVDIEPACKGYESDDVSILIGDQADRAFWASFKQRINDVDILIDDGGHTVVQQRVTIEEMLPFIRPGGLYLCEDIHGDHNQFGSFAASLINGLNSVDILPTPTLSSAVSQFQRHIHSIHFYPYVLIIEKNSTPVECFSAPKQGTEWQPFL